MLKIGVYNVEDEIREGVLGSEKDIIDLYSEEKISQQLVSKISHIR